MNETFPVLYILMRTDLTSMNAGKAMAQASHASNAFLNGDPGEPKGMLYGWCNATPQGFGTVLVLAVNEMQMRFAVDAAKRYDMLADIIHDPTYPILVDPELGKFLRSDPVIGREEPPVGLVVGDGDRYVTVPMDTCAYVFADKNDPITGMLLGGYKLHP